MNSLDIVQTFTEIANLSIAVRKMSNHLSDSEAKLQLARSAIQTVIHELDEGNISSDWLGEYLREALVHLR